MRRIGKHLVIDVAGDLHVLVHLMSAGRLQLYDKRASLRDRTSRLLLRLDDGRELRLREFGTKQAAWVKVLRGGDARGRRRDRDARAGGVARAAGGPARRCSRRRAPLHSVLRDQRVIAGIGRSWVDEILWTAKLSPFKRGDDLSRRGGGRAARRRSATCSTARCATTSTSCSCRSPTSCRCRSRSTATQGEPCPRCGTTIEAVHYEDYVMCYCPQDQTGGKVLKDRRLSRLLK